MRHEPHDRKHPLTHHRAPAAHHPDTRGNYISTFLRLLAILLAATLIAQAQWDIEESHTTASLRGIHNVGGGVAWASGTRGTVLRTEDGGYLWQPCTIPPDAKDLDFRGIQAFDENTAIVMSSGPGDQSRLYKTTDGCQTWKLLFTNPDKQGFWDNVAVWYFEKIYPNRPAQVAGEILGDPVMGRFRVYKFFDGYSTSGKHPNPWHNTSLEKDDDPSLAADAATNGAFAASNSCYQDTQFRTQEGKRSNSPYGRIFVTGGKDGSKAFLALPPVGDVVEPTKWIIAALPLGSRTESSGAFSVEFAYDHSAGVTVGGDYLKPNDSARTAAFTTDGGKTWQAATTPPHGYRSSVAYDPTQKLWITVGPNGTDISRDDGKNWQPLKPSGYDPADADKNWNALSIPFVVGPNGRIGKLRTITPTPPKP
jgi:photosystem II stability/assembly factor-like uncharacterized protein